MRPMCLKWFNQPYSVFWTWWNEATRVQQNPESLRYADNNPAILHPHPLVFHCRTNTPPPSLPAPQARATTIECCSHPFPWRGFHWVWRSHESGNHLRCGPRSIWQGHRCTETRACGWSGPHTAAAQSADAAAAALPGTCSWQFRSGVTVVPHLENET